MTTIEALAKLFEAMGGDDDDIEGIQTIPEMINAIADFIADGGMAELPDAAKATEGDVLTVVSGEWAAAALPADNT